MNRRAHGGQAFAFALAALLAVLNSAYGREMPKGPDFKYAGGTEALREGSEGTLELTSDTLTFKSSFGSVSVPYSSISLMEYRSDVSRQVRKLKLKWKVKPSASGGKRNRYFTVVFTQQGATRVMVLDVPPTGMRPYLAELDLKAGKRVEVQSHEDY